MVREQGGKEKWWREWAEKKIQNGRGESTVVSPPWSVHLSREAAVLSLTGWPGHNVSGPSCRSESSLERRGVYSFNKMQGIRYWIGYGFRRMGLLRDWRVIWL